MAAPDVIVVSHDATLSAHHVTLRAYHVTLRAYHVTLSEVEGSGSEGAGPYCMEAGRFFAIEDDTTGLAQAGLKRVFHKSFAHFRVERHTTRFPFSRE